MNQEDINKFTLAGLKNSLPELNIKEQKFNENNLEQKLEKNGFRIDVIYEFAKSAVDGKTGVNLIYTTTGDNNHQLRESVSIFTDYIEYDIKGAIEEFSKLDLPLINKYYDPSSSDDKVHYLESVYYNPFTNPEQVQGWKIYIGLQRKSVNNQFEYQEYENAKDLFNVIYQGVNNEIFKRKPEKTFIKNWISRKGNEGMWADCRVNNENWKLGQDLLFNYAESWNIGHDTISIKQNILLIPVSLNQLKKGEEILSMVKQNAQIEINKRKQLQKQKNNPISKKKKFWEFWK